jgi:hypothetical protein
MASYVFVAEKALTHPDIGAIAREIAEDGFTKTLWQAYEAGQIERGQLHLYLQEDAFWQNRIADWQVLGIQKYSRVNGELTDEFVGLDDIRSEILAEILQP